MCNIPYTGNDFSSLKATKVMVTPGMLRGIANVTMHGPTMLLIWSFQYLLCMGSMFRKVYNRICKRKVFVAVNSSLNNNTLFEKGKKCKQFKI